MSKNLSKQQGAHKTFDLHAVLRTAYNPLKIGYFSKLALRQKRKLSTYRGETARGENSIFIFFLPKRFPNLGARDQTGTRSEPGWEQTGTRSEPCLDQERQVTTIVYTREFSGPGLDPEIYRMIYCSILPHRIFVTIKFLTLV